MDDLLAELKAEFEPQQPRNAQQPQARKSQPPQKSTNAASMEQMLAELRTELESGRNRPGNPSQQPPTSTNNQADVTQGKNNRQRLNALIDAEYQQQAQKREAKLAEIKRQEEAKVAEQKRRQQELIEAQRREELRERRRKEALREQAQKWLKNLSLNSEEGRWFQEFSYSYESKLEAAIDYLEAMRETGL
jgi:uncharacterized protein (DUF885 family)